PREPPHIVLEAVEAELLEEGDELLDAGRADAGVLQGEGEVSLAPEGDQLAGEREVRARLLQVLSSLPLDLVEGGEDPVDRAELLYQLRRRLRPDPLYPWHVVHRVAHQR